MKRFVYGVSALVVGCGLVVAFGYTLHATEGAKMVEKAAEAARKPASTGEIICRESNQAEMPTHLNAECDRDKAFSVSGGGYHLFYCCVAK